MHMEPAAQVEGGVPGMGVLIDNRPRRARAGATRKRAALSPWLSAGGKKFEMKSCGFGKVKLTVQAKFNLI